MQAAIILLLGFDDHVDLGGCCSECSTIVGPAAAAHRARGLYLPAPGRRAQSVSAEVTRPESKTYAASSANPRVNPSMG